MNVFRFLFFMVLLPCFFSAKSQNIDGSIDSSFGNYGFVNTNLGYSNAYATYATAQNDGKIVAVGTCNNGTYNDMLVARFLQSGVIDSTFGNNGKTVIDFYGFNDGATILKILSNGKLLVGGNSYNSPSQMKFTLIRLFSNGQIDSSFGNQGKVVLSINSSILGLDVQSNGKIIAAGTDTIVRFLVNGAIDSLFGANGFVKNKSTKVLLILNDDKFIVTGGLGMRTCKYLPSGIIDSTFGLNGSYENFDTGVCGSLHFRQLYYSTSLCSDLSGNIYLAGQYTPPKGTGTSPCDPGTYSSPIIFKLNNSGMPVSNFGSNGIIFIDSYAPISKCSYSKISITFCPLNKIILSGSYQSFVTGIDPNKKAAIFRLKLNGSLDSTFGNAGVKYCFLQNNITNLFDVNTNFIQNDSSIVLAGSQIMGPSSIALARLKAFINRKPFVNFTSNFTYGNTNTIFTFNDSSLSISPLTYTWVVSPDSALYVNSTDRFSQNPQVKFRANGSYSVKLIASNIYGIDSLIKTNYITITNTGIETLTSNDGVLVYPNPAMDEVEILSPQSAIKKITVFDILGNKMEQTPLTKLTTEKYIITTRQLTPSCYVLVIETDEGISMKKLMINR